MYDSQRYPKKFCRIKDTKFSNYSKYRATQKGWDFKEEKKTLFTERNLSFRLASQQTKITLKWSLLLPSRSRVLDEFQNGIIFCNSQAITWCLHRYLNPFLGPPTLRAIMVSKTQKQLVVNSTLTTSCSIQFCLVGYKSHSLWVTLYTLQI